MVVLFYYLVGKDQQFLTKKQTNKFTVLQNLLMYSSHDSEYGLEDVNFRTLVTVFPFEGEDSTLSCGLAVTHFNCRCHGVSAS